MSCFPVQKHYLELFMKKVGALSKRSNLFQTVKDEGGARDQTQT